MLLEFYERELTKEEVDFLFLLLKMSGIKKNIIGIH